MTLPMQRTEPPACAPTLHRHAPACAKCGHDDGPLYALRTASGDPWPAMCGQCIEENRRVRRTEKDARIAAAERSMARTDCE